MKHTIYLRYPIVALLLVGLQFVLGCASRAAPNCTQDSSAVEIKPLNQRTYFGLINLPPTTLERSKVDIERVTGFGLRIGRMKAAMDWWPIYRDVQQSKALSDKIGKTQVKP